MLIELLSKCRPLECPICHQLQSSLGYSYQSHAMMNPPWAKAALSNLEASSFSQKNIGCWHFDIVKVYFHVAVGSIIVSEDRARSQNLNSWSVHWNQNHRVLLVLGLVIVWGHTHYYSNFASRITCSA